MNYIYGPLKSRRLGMSLGLSITPYKTCPLDCVYCQLKKTTKLTLQRKEYVKPKAVLTELEHFLQDNAQGKHLDSITLSGSGEPMLNSKIGDIITGIKQRITLPVVLITNSVLLQDDVARHDVLGADIILPSLDAFTQDVFERIDRPLASTINVEKIIGGLIKLRQEFKGKLWLEIMLVKDINDDIEYMKRFKEIIDVINPDRIQLNRPTRPPCEVWVKSPHFSRLKRIKEILGEKCEII